jgi:hypothetical protein
MEETRFNDAEIYEPTEEELEALSEFSDALVTDERPDIEAWLARFPHLAGRLRPLYETAVWLKDGFDELKRKYPGLHAWHLLGLPAKVR